MAMLRSVLVFASCVAAAAYTPAHPRPARAHRLCTAMSCAMPLSSSPVSPSADAVSRVEAMLQGLVAEMEAFELPRILLAIPNRRGPSNKARAGVSGFRARKLTKTGQRVLRNRRKKGRKNIIPSPGRHPVHGL